MAFKIIIKRSVPEDKRKALLPLLEQLRDMALRQPGYFYGESLIAMDDPEKHIVISTWQSFDNWLAWAGSRPRHAMQARIDELLGTVTEYEFYRHPEPQPSLGWTCRPYGGLTTDSGEEQSMPAPIMD